MKLLRRWKKTPRPWTGRRKPEDMRIETKLRSKDSKRIYGTLSPEDPVRRVVWKPCLFQYRCECLRELEEGKKVPKSNRTGISEGKQLKYPINEDPSTQKILKTFQIKYDGKLSLLAECMLSTFQNKYIYYAIDDILYLLHSNLKEQENLLELFYSSMLSLHNESSINFFDIWIDSIYINDTYKNNRFLINKSQKLKQGTYITLKLYYLKRSPIKKPEPIW